MLGDGGDTASFTEPEDEYEYETVYRDVNVNYDGLGRDNPDRPGFSEHFQAPPRGFKIWDDYKNRKTIPGGFERKEGQWFPRYRWETQVPPDQTKGWSATDVPTPTLPPNYRGQQFKASRRVRRKRTARAEQPLETATTNRETYEAPSFAASNAPRFSMTTDGSGHTHSSFTAHDKPSSTRFVHTKPFGDGPTDPTASPLPFVISKSMTAPATDIPTPSPHPATASASDYYTPVAPQISSSAVADNSTDGSVKTDL
jgi:hypothetical protein